MNPQDPASFSHRTEKLETGRTYHFVDQLPDHFDPEHSPTILCIHGFPDLWFGWRNQIGPWVHMGYRVVAPDMLGYGGTDKPEDASEYSTRKLTADLASLLDLLEIGQAVVIGHDWGAFTAGRFALWHPQRVLALVIMSVPYTPPSRVYLPVEEVARLVPNLGYQVDFANPANTSLIEANLLAFLSLIFKPPGAQDDYTSQGSLIKLFRTHEGSIGPSVLNGLEFEYYYRELRKGMTGPLNYYRTTKYRYEEELAAGLSASLPPDLPVLFMWGTSDPTVTPHLINRAKRFIQRIQNVPLEGRGHWILVEAKDEVTERVRTWLREHSSKPLLHGKL